MKKGIKRFLSVMLAFVMVLGMTVTVSAENEQVENEHTVTGNVQVSVLGETDPVGLNFNLYKIVKLMDTKDGDSMEQEASELQWVTEELKNAVVAQYPALEDPSALSGLTQTEVDAFYQWLASIIREDVAKGDGAELNLEALDGTKATVTDGVTFTYNTGAENVDPVTVGGYIAIADDGINVYRPAVFTFLPTYNTTSKVFEYPTNPAPVNMKYTKPQIEKKITDSEPGSVKADEATVAWGDVVTFDITTTVPTYAGDYNADKIRYTMVDIYRNAYAPNVTTGNLIVKGHTGDADVTGTDLTGSYTTYSGMSVYVDDLNNILFVGNGTRFYGLDGEALLTPANIPVASETDALNAYNTAHGTTIAKESLSISQVYASFVVDFTGNYDMIKGYQKISYQYPAAINTGNDTTGTGELVGADTNMNIANLAYSNNARVPEEIANVKDDVKSYTYGIEITKTDGTNGDKLAGAIFDLYELYSSSMTEEEFALLDQGTSGKDYVREADGKVYKLLQAGLITDDTGLIKVSGLDLGEYLLVETSAPNGYNRLEQNQVVTLSQAGNKAYVTGGNNTGYFAQSIQNYKGVTLPSTGGMGTTVFTMVGIMMMAGAMLVVVLRRREEM